MNTANEIKEQLYNYCMTHINNRINNIEDILRSIKEAKNNETKSSAGDKYETSRAMMQIEENPDENPSIEIH